jgi:peptidoglycan/LPS O-acetylase OafA/YrhL
MSYRKDIDGLRAVAVTSVVLFHAGVGVFSGGFVGVDIFFVISGYLITSLIVDEVEKGRFSFAQFYERRARRIFPALFLVVILTSLGAYLLFMPSTYDDFSKSVFGCALFVSNIVFWRETGYFAAPAGEKPLLHTWSLAVEEQFYIVFPLILVFAMRWSGAKRVILLGSIGAISFIVSVIGVSYYPSATFYLAPTRAWELLLGALTALLSFQNSIFVSPKYMAIIGASSVLFSIFMFDSATLFPGASALLPTAGTALILYAGKREQTVVNNLLGIKPFVFVGLISYSLYLWHWPLLVFARAGSLHLLPSFDIALIVLLSFLCGSLSWRFVELPFRKRTALRSRTGVFLTASVVMICFVCEGLWGHLSHGWPARLPSEVQEIAAASRSGYQREAECFPSPDKPMDVAQACVFGARVNPTIALWGDSHANVLISMLGGIVEKDGRAIKFFGYRGCPPLQGVGRIGEYRGCFSRNDEVMSYILSDERLKIVILASRWSFYLYGYNKDFGPAEQDWGGGEFITDGSGSLLSEHQRESLFSAATKATVDRLVNAGKTVILVYPIPETGYDIPVTLGSLALRGQDPDQFTRPFEYFRRRQKFVFEVFDGMGDSSRIKRVYPHERLCDASRCIVSVAGRPLYQDSDHLSPAGADYLAPIFSPLLSNVSVHTGQE